MAKAARWLVVLLLAACLVPGALAEEKSAESKLGDEIDEAIQRSTKGGFWGAVAVVKDGEILLQKGYGFADLAKRRNDPNTLFEIASLSKQFTAAAILKLEQQGKLKLSDTLAKFFPDIPDDKKVITVRHLVTHTSGLSNKIGVPYSSPLTREQYITHILKTPRTHAPGDHFAYNNAAYAILAAVVEVASGESFEDYSKGHVFEPAGMSDTGFVQDARLMKSGRAAARLGPGRKGISAVDWHWGWGYRGMGGVVTTLVDLVKWDAALWGEKVLGTAAKKKLFEPFKNGYAGGWFVETTARGTKSVNHGGGVQGFRCIMERGIDESYMLVVLTNDGGNPHQIRKVIRNHLWPPPRVEVTLDATSHTLSKHRGAEMDAKWHWEVEGGAKITKIRLKDGSKGTPAEIRVPSSYVGKLSSQLESAIRARSRDDEGKPAEMEGGVYFGAYPAGSKRVELTEKLEVRVMPQYNQEKRMCFVVLDPQNRFWPVLVKMNVAAAKILLKALR